MVGGVTAVSPTDHRTPVPPTGVWANGKKATGLKIRQTGLSL